MEITEFVTSKTLIPLAELTSLAANRAAFGDDVLAAFRTQIELRSATAQAVLTGAEQAGRDALLASEQRSYDGAIRERDSILSLQQVVERRTEQRAFVPPTQVGTSEIRPADLSPVLGKEQRCADWLKARGGARFADEAGAETARFGAVVRALALGDRRGLSAIEQRALSEGSGAAGGYAVPEILAAPFIDRVRSAMVVMRAGAQTVPMTSDTLHIARLAQPGIYTGSPSVNAAIGAWKVENDPITEGALALERVTFTARTLPLLLKLSVELSEDSANIDTIIEREMAAAMALELDRVALVGSGVAPEPKGIRYQDNVAVTSFAGAAPTTHDFMVDAVGRLWVLNHEPNAFLMAPVLATTVAKFKEGASNQPLRVPEAIAAIPRFRTNQIPAANSSPDSTMLFTGDFTQLMVGIRTSFTLEVSRIAAGAFENLQIAVRAYLRADVQLAHPEAFDVLDSVGY